MRDPFAAFYGGYDRTALVRRPALHLHPIRIAFLIAVPVLAVFVVSDVALATGTTSSIRVTAVDWEVDGAVLATAAGFEARPSHVVSLTLTCTDLCYRFTGATASSPFVVTAFSTVDQPIQFTNVSVQTPSSGYTGVLTISLVLGINDTSLARGP
jgi:hypothetical protein